MADALFGIFVEDVNSFGIDCNGNGVAAFFSVTGDKRGRGAEAKGEDEDKRYYFFEISHSFKYSLKILITLAPTVSSLIHCIMG